MLRYGMAKEFFSERFRYRPLNDQDMDILTSLMTSPEVMRYISGGVPRSPEQIESMLRKSLQQMADDTRIGYWVILDAKTEDKLGNLILREPATDSATGFLEVGYTILPEHWDKGIASEALGALIKHVKSMESSTRLMALIDPQHPKSRNVLLKNNFVFKGHLDYISPADGKRFPSEYFEHEILSP